MADAATLTARPATVRAAPASASSRPTSTVIGPSPVHTGLCSSPEATLERLFERLVV